MRTLFFVGVLATTGCAAAPSPAGSAVAPPLQDTYTAHGNEPFWRLEADANGATWRTPEGERRADGPPIVAPTPITPGWSGFSARFAGETLTIEISQTPCADSMSGQVYPHTVRVRFEAQTYAGCGGDPLSLLSGEWRAFQGDVEIGTVNISADGAVNAHAGCNRMAGTLFVTGEGIAIGPLSATRMACAAPIMAQERALATGLQASTAFNLEQDGAIHLTGQSGSRIRLVRR
jgi:uncharacterized membrane protein